MKKDHREKNTAVENIKSKGFTLIEILVAAAIISVLSFIAVSVYQLANKNANDARRKADLEQVRTALEMYRTENGYYPSSRGSYINLSEVAGLVPAYLPSIPNDPLPATHPNYKPYRYQSTNRVGSYYYGYCLSANLENSTPVSNPCTPANGYNYSVKNP